MLAASAVVLLGLAFGLVQLTRSATQAAAPAPAHRAADTPATPVPTAAPAAPAAPPLAAAREPSPAAAPPRGRIAAPALPTLSPAPAGFARAELKRDANGHLVPIVPFQDLRAQIPRTDAPMKACIERAGVRASGKATLSFTVAARAGKLVVEATSVQDEDTLAAYPELLECMHRTANALVLDDKPIPELGTPIYVRRHIRLDNGVLAENSFFNFSYNP